MSEEVEITVKSFWKSLGFMNKYPLDTRNIPTYRKSFKKIFKGETIYWCVPVISVLGRLRQEHGCEVKVSLDYKTNLNDSETLSQKQNNLSGEHMLLYKFSHVILFSSPKMHVEGRKCFIVSICCIFVSESISWPT